MNSQFYCKELQTLTTTIYIYKHNNMSVVLVHDVSISGNTKMKVGAVIQWKVAGGTTTVKRRALTEKSSILLATLVVNIQANTTNPLVPIQLLNLSSSVTLLLSSLNHFYIPVSYLLLVTFYSRLDACQCGIGAVLSWIHRDGTERKYSLCKQRNV